MFVGRAVMHASRFEQPSGGTFQHQALRRAHVAQREQLGPRDDSGIGVRQQTSGVEHRSGGGHQIRHRGGVAQRVQFGAGLGVSELGLVAQREQRLPAAGLGAAPRHVDHFVQCQIGPLAGPRRLGERAVVTHVPAQLGERDEHLSRVADRTAEPGIAQRRRALHERG